MLCDIYTDKTSLKADKEDWGWGKGATILCERINFSDGRICLERMHLRLARLRVGLRGASQLRCCQRLASIPQFMPSMLSETLVLSVTCTSHA